MKPPANPFVGLRPFQSDESHLFFGRRGQIRDVLVKLQERRLLAVVGRSGCGKSSLVRAGLIPALAAGFLVDDREHWRMTVTQPGSSPLRNLATALWTTEQTRDLPPEELHHRIDQLTARLRTAGARAVFEHLSDRPGAAHVPIGEDENLLVVVDQFEELFRFGLRSGNEETRDEAARFVAIILALAERRQLPIYVVLTMRSDYLRDCDAFYGLPEAINRSLYLVPRLTREMRREIVEGPVALFGAAITPKLVERLLDESDDECRFDASEEEPDQLPVLQHALMRTWERWRALTGDDAAHANPDARPIDETDYEAVGALKCALSNDANTALRPGDDERTKRVFQALTETDARKRRIRRAATTLDIIAEAGLPDEQSLWDVVNPFRSDGRTFLVLYTVAGTAGAAAEICLDISHESLIRRWDKLAQWVAEEAESADLYRWIAGEAHKARTGTWPLLRDGALDEAETWWRTKRPNAAWGRRYCPDVEFQDVERFLERSRAERDRIQAEQERQRLAEEKRAQDELARTAQLADARARLLETSEKHAIAQKRTVRLTRMFLATVSAGAVLAVIATVFSATAWRRQEDERTYFSLTTDARERLETRPQQSVLLAMEAFRRRSEALRDFSVENLVLEGLSRIGGRALAGHSGEVRSIAFTSDTRHVITASADGSVRRWSAGRHSEDSVVLPEDRNSPIVIAAVAPDDRTIAVGTGDGTVKLLDVSGQLPARALPAGRPGVPGGAVTALAFTRGGQCLIAGFENGRAQLWNLSAPSGAPHPVVEGNDGPILFVKSSADGRWFLIGAERMLSIWQPADCTAPRRIPWPAGHVQARVAEISADGKVLFTGRPDGMVDRWVLQPDGRIGASGQVLEPGGAVSALAASPDGRWLAAGSLTGALRIWDLRSHSLRAEYPALKERGIWLARISPDSRWLVTVNTEGGVRLRDLLAPPAVSAGPSPAPASATGSDPGDGQHCMRLRGHEGFVHDVAFARDSRFIATAGADGTARLWDLTAPDPADSSVRHRGGRADIQAMTISADLRWLVTGTPRGLQRLELTGTRQAPAAPDTHPDASPGPAASADVTFYTAKLTSDSRWLATLSARADPNRRDQGEWDLTLYDNTAAEPLFAQKGVSTVQFSSDNASMITGHSDGHTALWRLDHRQPVQETLTVPARDSSPIIAAAIDGRNRRLATLTRSGVVRAWDVSTPTPREILSASRPKDSLALLTVSGDGRWLAAGERDRSPAALVWDLDAPQTAMRELAGHRGALTALAVSPNNDLLVTASEDGTARVYCFATVFDLPADVTRRCKQDDKRDAWFVFDRHRGAVDAVRISPENNRLLTIDREGMVRVWSLAEPSPEYELLPGGTGPILEAVFGRDGKSVTTGSTDGTVRSLQLDIPSLKDRARQAVGRNLSEAEWCQAASASPYEKTFEELPIWKQGEDVNCDPVSISVAVRVARWAERAAAWLSPDPTQAAAR